MVSISLQHCESRIEIPLATTLIEVNAGSSRQDTGKYVRKPSSRRKGDGILRSQRSHLHYNTPWTHLFITHCQQSTPSSMVDYRRPASFGTRKDKKYKNKRSCTLRFTASLHIAQTSTYQSRMCFFCVIYYGRTVLPVWLAKLVFL